MARGRTLGAFGLARVEVERGWMKRCRKLGIEPGAELAQMFHDARKSGDHRAALVILAAAHKFITPAPVGDAGNQVSFAGVGWIEPDLDKLELGLPDEVAVVAEQ
jgi:hypothetical protein